MDPASSEFFDEDTKLYDLKFKAKDNDGSGKKTRLVFVVLGVLLRVFWTVSRAVRCEFVSTLTPLPPQKLLHTITAQKQRRAHPGLPGLPGQVPDHLHRGPVRRGRLGRLQGDHQGRRHRGACVCVCGGGGVHAVRCCQSFLLFLFLPAHTNNQTNTTNHRNPPTHKNNNPKTKKQTTI